MKKRLIVLMIMSVLLLLVACGETSPEPTATVEPSPTTIPTDEPTATTEPTATIAPTATTEPTNTPEPTATATTVPTDTPEPTATTAVIDPATIAMGERQVVEEGGYSYQPVAHYEWNSQEESAIMGDRDGTIVISMIGLPTGTMPDSPQETIDEFVNSTFDAAEGSFEMGELTPIMIGETEGTAVDVVGELWGSSVAGKAVLMEPTEGWLVFALAISNLSADENQWRDAGQYEFQAVLDSIIFSEEAPALPPSTDSTNGPCVISVNPTYGYSEENAIEVGGDSFGGPPRARAFLDNLLGPNGETITYTRQGSLPYGDTILDIYMIDHAGLAEPAALYIDQYNYSRLVAPVDFTCASAFIAAP